MSERNDRPLMTREAFDKLLHLSNLELDGVKERLTKYLLEVDPDDDEAKTNLENVITMIEARDKLCL